MNDSVGVLKTLWGQEQGRWQITSVAALDLQPSPGDDPFFFRVGSEVRLLQTRPSGKTFEEILLAFGPTDYLLKQSILPVVLIEHGASTLRCIGTAFVISCTGYVMTAYHVVADPLDREPNRFRRNGAAIEFPDDIELGVLVPYHPALNMNGIRFFPFEQGRYWGTWQSSPLLHEPERFNPLLDIAICKVQRMPSDMAHQPLTLSRFPFVVNETAFAIGYAEMKDVPIARRGDEIAIPGFEAELFVSRGNVTAVFPHNHIQREMPTPGPCFDYKALIPGKMSGAPIFGGDGAVVRGVVSRSFSGERHATGAMLDPVLGFPISEKSTLGGMMLSGGEGIPHIRGPDRL